MAIRYTTASGSGLTSGNGTTIATALTLTFALGATSPLVAGDELRILNDGIYLRTAATRSVEHATGTGGSHIKWVGCSASGIPYSASNRGYAYIYADSGSDWDVTNVTPGLRRSMFTIGRAGGGTDPLVNPLQYVDVSNLWISGNRASYNCFQNGGVGNAFFDNTHWSFTDCIFIDAYHNQVSLFGARNDGTDMVQDAHTFTRCKFLNGGRVAAGNRGYGLIARPHPTAACSNKASFVCTDCDFDGNSQGGVFIGAVVLGSTFTRCSFTRGNYPAHGTSKDGIVGAEIGGDAAATTFHTFDSCVFANNYNYGLQLTSRNGDVVKNCLFAGNGEGPGSLGAGYNADIKDTNWSIVTPPGYTFPYQNCGFSNTANLLITADADEGDVPIPYGSTTFATQNEDNPSIYGIKPDFVKPNLSGGEAGRADFHAYAAGLRTAGYGFVQIGLPTTNPPSKRPYHYYGR